MQERAQAAPEVMHDRVAGSPSSPLRWADEVSDSEFDEQEEKLPMSTTATSCGAQRELSSSSEEEGHRSPMWGDVADDALLRWPATPPGELAASAAPFRPQACFFNGGAVDVAFQAGGLQQGCSFVYQAWNMPLSDGHGSPQQGRWQDPRGLQQGQQVHLLCALPSLGSSSHSVGKCKPCAFFHREVGCANGAACSFCHLCDSGEKQKRRKQKYAAMQARQMGKRAELRPPLPMPPQPRPVGCQQAVDAV